MHVWTTDLARLYAELHIITPPIAEATASGSGTERDPGAMVALKAELNRRVLSQTPAAAVAMLEYKIAERGGTATVEVSTTAPVLAGNLIVEAAKQTRALRKVARHAR